MLKTAILALKQRKAVCMEENHKDFFISYTKADRQWAEWIAWQLDQAGYSLVIQAWDFGPGKNFVWEMHNATIQTERTIMVLPLIISQRVLLNQNGLLLLEETH